MYVWRVARWSVATPSGALQWHTSELTDLFCGLELAVNLMNELNCDWPVVEEGWQNRHQDAQGLIVGALI